LAYFQITLSARSPLPLSVMAIAIFAGKPAEMNTISLFASWRWYGVAFDALVSPKLFASGRIVGDYELVPGGDYFRALRRVDQQRRGPARLHLAWRPPNFLAGLFVERDDE